MNVIRPKSLRHFFLSCSLQYSAQGCINTLGNSTHPTLPYKHWILQAASPTGSVRHQPCPHTLLPSDLQAERLESWELQHRAVSHRALHSLLCPPTGKERPHRSTLPWRWEWQKSFVTQLVLQISTHIFPKHNLCDSCTPNYWHQNTFTDCVEHFLSSAPEMHVPPSLCRGISRTALPPSEPHHNLHQH